MLLYHGTSATLQPAIQAQGLQPRGDRPGVWSEDYHAPSLPQMVYLTKTPFQALWYALRTSLLLGGDGLLVTVKTTEEKLYPDENFFIEEHQGRLDKSEITTAQTCVTMMQTVWDESLTQKGLVCHEGAVDPGHCIHYWTVPKDQNPWKFLDAQTVVDFDWLMTAVSATMEHFGVAGFDVARLKEYSIRQVDRGRYLVGIPDCPVLKVIREE